MVFPFIIIFSILGSIGAISLAAIFLAFPEKIRGLLVPTFVSYAIGTLAAGAFLGLIPNAIELAPVTDVMLAVLGGIFGFFILEKMLLWRHYHYTGHQHPEIAVGHEVKVVAAPLILIGDAFHNFVDGVIIAASFLVSTELGFATSLAVIAHEIPQEVSDFGILLQSGLSQRKAFLYNAISSATTMPGAIFAYLFLIEVEAATPYMMAISAASFIYIALSDLVPHLHHKREYRIREVIRQSTLILAGIITIALIIML
jgi:zinc and cadmium transporter